MATLERKKKTAIQARVEHHDDLTDDPVLAWLASEPMEYQTLSTQVVHSLESVKHICLQVLDFLLRKLVQDLPRNNQRRRSSSDLNLLESITQNTNILQTSMRRSQSSPPATNIFDVHRILEKTGQPLETHDATLACALAALLNDVYRLLELNSSHHPLPVLPITNISLLQQQLHDQVTHFQSERAQGIMRLDDASDETKMLWDEMDHLMTVVTGLVLQLPPAYADLVPPPAYHEAVMEKGHDLDLLLCAIDRLSVAAPRLNNQRVGLSTRQVDELAAATLGRTVERLSSRRLENQRAFLPLKSRHELLQDLIQQVQTSASRSLDNQRVTLTVNQQRKMEEASMGRLLDRCEKRRYKNQECQSKEARLIQDLTRTTDLLVKSLNCRPVFQRQRFSISAFKERFQQKNLQQDTRDLDLLLENIYKSKPQYMNQRASFSL